MCGHFQFPPNVRYALELDEPPQLTAPLLISIRSKTAAIIGSRESKGFLSSARVLVRQ
jgi:hypothetical protein